MTAATRSLERPHIDVGSIARAGALVALLDGSFVVVLYVLVLHLTTPSRIFQGVASALLGKAAFDGGATSTAIGLCIHVCVAFAWTIVWVTILSRSPALRKRVSTTSGIVIAGVVYGMLVWLMMNNVIMPFTQAKVAAFTNWQFWVQLAWHPFGVGLPIVAINRPR